LTNEEVNPENAVAIPDEYSIVENPVNI
jgi:hypothetical protein